MKRTVPGGELFPDAAAIQTALERRTRAALLQRLGPVAAPRPTPDPLLPAIADHAARDKARGVGFGVELVRAILSGRKTQTRRPVRPRPAIEPTPRDCPVARPGELLYVREPWLRTHDEAGHARIEFAADESHPGRRFRPAMYMARDAARLWLRVSFVRAERLQAITPADLEAEGLMPGQSLATVWDQFYTDPGERWSDNPWVWAIGFDVEA